MIQIIKHREKIMSSFNLKKRTVIITGASGGFGSELTKILINDYGCRVIGIGKTKEKLQALADSLESGKNKFKYYVFDVSDRENWRKFADKLTESCVIPDLLINNAGIMPPFEKFEDEDGELAKRVIDVNLMSVIYGCEAMIPLLKASRQGGIVNISSSSAFSPSVGIAVYSASKAAVRNFSMSLSEELYPDIFVATVCPGFAKTDLFRDNDFDDEDFDFISSLGSDKKDIAEAIIEGLSDGKKLIICGKDSRLMNAMSSVAPVKSNELYSKVLKDSKLNMFRNLKK